MTVTTPRPCSYCNHVYANPCDGEDGKCQNKLFIDGKLPGISPPAAGNKHPVEDKPKRERVPLIPKPKRERVALEPPPKRPKQKRHPLLPEKRRP